MIRTLRLSVVVVLAVLLVAFQEAVPPELRSADSLAALVEEMERSYGPTMTPGEQVTAEEVARELLVVQGYLDDHPGDPTALLLTVRLGRIQDLLEMEERWMAFFEDPEAAPVGPERHDAYLGTLEGLLERFPDLAAAHFWMGRILLEKEAQRGAMEEGTVGVSPGIPETVEQVLPHALAAVEHGPDEPAHREFLAMLRASQDRLEEAEAVLDHPSTAGSLLHLLLKDVVELRPPLPVETDAAMERLILTIGTMSAAGAEEPELLRHIEMRAWGWSTPASLEAVEAAYRERWPVLRFFDDEAGFGGRAAGFLLRDGSWRPITGPEGWEKLNRYSGDDAMVMFLPAEEYAGLAAAMAGQETSGESEDPGPRVGILLLNSRLTGSSNGPP